MKYYSEEHQWVEIEGGKARIGITKFAADELGELSYVELPSVGSIFTSVPMSAGLTGQPKIFMSPM